VVGYNKEIVTSYGKVLGLLKLPCDAPTMVATEIKIPLSDGFNDSRSGMCQHSFVFLCTF